MISILQRTVTIIHDWQHAYRPCLLAILWTKLFQKRMVCTISNIDLRYHYYYRVTIQLLVDYEGIIYPVINVSALIWLIRYIVCLRHYMFPLLPVSLDCPFLLPLRYSLMFIYARNFQFLNNVIYRSSGEHLRHM